MPAPDDSEGNLYEADGDARVHGDITGHSRGSLYTWFELRPAARVLALGALIGGAALLGSSRAAARRPSAGRPADTANLEPELESQEEGGRTNLSEVAFAERDPATALSESA